MFSKIGYKNENGKQPYVHGSVSVMLDSWQKRKMSQEDILSAVFTFRKINVCAGSPDAIPVNVQDLHLAANIQRRNQNH